MQQKTLARLQEIGDKNCDNDMSVNLTIYNVPASLLREFAQKIISPCYPGGVSEAMKDLMRKAILNHDMKQEDAAALPMLDKQRAAGHG